MPGSFHIRITFSRFIHVVVCVSSVLLYEYTKLCIFILLSLYIWDVSAFFTIVNDASMNIHIQDFMWTYVLLLWGIYLGVKLLGHVVTPCLILWGLALVYSSWKWRKLCFIEGQVVRSSGVTGILFIMKDTFWKDAGTWCRSRQTLLVTWGVLESQGSLVSWWRPEYEMWVRLLEVAVCALPLSR